MTQNEPGGRSPRPVHPVRPVPSAVEPAARGISQVTALVPHLLGYHPDHSLVLLVVRPDASSGHGVVRGRVGFSARIDLPDPEQVDQLTAVLTGPVWHGVGGDEGRGRSIVQAIVYDVPEDELGAPSQMYLDRLTDVLRDICDQLGVMLHDLVLVRPVDRHRPADGHRPDHGQRHTDQRGTPQSDGPRVLEHRALLRAGEELDEPWAPLPSAADVPGTAELALRGRSPLGSRDELVARVRQRDESASAAASLALDVLALSPGRLDEDLALSRLGSWVVHGEPPPTPRERAWIAVLLHDKTYRDAVLAQWVPELFDLDEILPPVEADSVRRHVPALPEGECLAPVGRLLTLAGQVPRDLTAPLLTLAGFVAWAHGEGTVALEADLHALEVDPGYRMAQLLDRALASGMRPPAVAGPDGAGLQGRRGVA